MAIIGKSDYKFRIEKHEEGFVFVLYPNNNNNQPIGISGEAFPNKAQCERALSIFRNIIKSNDPYSLLDYGKESDLKWEPFLIDNGAIIFYRSIPYNDKSSCESWVKEISDNIDADLKQLV